MPLRRLAAAILVLAACRGETGLRGAPATTGGSIRLVATEYAFAGVPDTVQAGWHKVLVVNQGAEPHMSVLARLDSGKTVAEFVAAMKADSNVGWAPEFGGPNAVFPGDSIAAAVHLSAGRYVVVCFVPDSAGRYHLLDGMISPFTVADNGQPAMAEPAGADTIHLTSYQIAFTSPPTAGTHVYRVENHDPGATHHDLVIVRLADGKTRQDAIAWLGASGGPPPFAVAGATTGMLPGFHDYVYLNLRPGEYLALCFMPDAADGKPHWLHGMVQSFTVGS